jgi:hypothetical protein
MSHVTAALAQQMLCFLTNSDHFVFKVTASSLIDTADSQPL